MNLENVNSGNNDSIRCPAISNLYRNDFTISVLNDTIKRRIYGFSYKADCTVPYEELRYLRLLHIGFDKKVHRGELICNKYIADRLIAIFYRLFLHLYPIEKIHLVDDYHADDTKSCLDNNSSCFNYRLIEGTNVLSRHATGMAVDINPAYNPYITVSNGEIHVSPNGSERFVKCRVNCDGQIHCIRNLCYPHQITEDDYCYRLFSMYGFDWGGHWTSPIDYQHFELKQKRTP